MPEQITGRDIFQASESLEEDGVEWITIIKEGVSENNRNYKLSTLERAVESGVYNDLKMFVDHSEGPPLKRSFRELVSAITETKLDRSFPDGKARVRGAIEWIDDDFKEKAHKASKHVGVSHDAVLRGTRSLKNGRRYEDIDEIKKAHSVDWVIYPSAGGGFEQFIAKEGVEMTDAIDWDAIDEEMLKENKPDLYKALTTRAKESTKVDDDDEDDEDDEDRAQEAVSPKLIKKLESSVEQIVTRALESAETKQKARKNTSAQVADLVNRSTLPKVTKDRVIRQFEGTESFDESRVTEAIEEAKKEVAAIAGPRIRSMGPTGTAAGGSSKVVVGRAHESVSSVFGFNPIAQKEEEKN